MTTNDSMRRQKTMIATQAIITTETHGIVYFSFTLLESIAMCVENSNKQKGVFSDITKYDIREYECIFITLITPALFVSRSIACKCARIPRKKCKEKLNNAFFLGIKIVLLFFLYFNVWKGNASNLYSYFFFFL